MTLQDLLRTHTYATLELLREKEDGIRKIGQKRIAALKQIESLETEIFDKREAEKEKGLHLQQAETKIQEIEREIENLKNERERLNEETKGLSDGRLCIVTDVESFQQEIKKHRIHVDDFDRQIDRQVKGKKRLEKKIQDARCSALAEYLESLESRLSQFVAARQEQAEKIESRNRFERARHEDTEIMTLSEARTEINELLRIANVQSVREQLQSQLQHIESHIESLFPGALAFENQPEKGSPIEELYYDQLSEHVARLLFPISRCTWEEIDEGVTSDSVSSALRLLWGTARSLQIKGHNTRFMFFRNHLCLEIESDLNSLSESTNILMPLPESGEATLLLRNLPREIQNALAHEDIDR